MTNFIETEQSICFNKVKSLKIFLNNNYLYNIPLKDKSKASWCPSEKSTDEYKIHNND